MTRSPTLETARLIMRMPIESDFLEELDFWQSERARFLGGRKSRGEVWRLFAMLIGHWQIRGYGFFCVLDKKTREYLGRVGHWFPEGWPEREIGWTLMEKAEGKGIAKEAAMAAREYAYRTLGWETAISLIDPENNRSIALAKRLGAQYEREFSHADKGLMGIYRHPSKEASS